MPKDNRRRIKEEILEEIEGKKGGNFTEKLLNWKNSQDNLSQELADTIESLQGVGEKPGKTVEELRERHEQQDSSSLGVDDVVDAVESVLRRVKIDKHGEVILE